MDLTTGDIKQDRQAMSNHNQMNFRDFSAPTITDTLFFSVGA